MTRVALVHDWLTGMRGGEYVLEAIAELFPDAELFTLLHIPGKVSPILSQLKKHTSALQKIPGIEQNYRYFLPLMPSMIQKFDLQGFDLIISSSHCVAKGILKPKESVHVSYIHAPMRYIWDRFDEYFGPSRSSPIVQAGARIFRKNLQNWDRNSSNKDRIDLILANSRFISEQIRVCYDLESEVIYPFVDLERFKNPKKQDRGYLIVGAFAPYKRVDLAIQAFNRLRLPLLIVGSGQDEERLKKLAGPSVQFLGSLSNSAIANLYSESKAFIFPGVEDFGITPLESMAAGTPVIAYAKGGALETVTEETGIFFSSQSVEGLIEAVKKMERSSPQDWESNCRQRAALFSKKRFQKELTSAIRNAWQTAGKDPNTWL